MIILNGIGDQLSSLVWQNFSRLPEDIQNELIRWDRYHDFFREFIHPLETNQPLFWKFLSIFLTFFGANSYNFFILMTVIANLFGSYLLFRRFKYGFLYSFLYAFSVYFSIHAGLHPDIQQIWVFPVFLYLLLYKKYRSKIVRNITLVSAITVISLISNYNGFMTLILYSSYEISSQLLNFIFEKKLNYSFLLDYLRVCSLAVLFTGLLLFPYIKANYFGSTEGGPNLNRQYEDFFTFSSRPWYFIIPPVKNPVLGEYSYRILENIRNTNYFLADDYFAAEHQSSYFGLVFLLLVFLTTLYHLRKGFVSGQRILLVWLTTALILITITMPPYFTISGLKIYTPGEIIYRLFPIFRVTSRLSIIILLSLLMFLAQAVEGIIDNRPDLRLRFQFIALLIFFMILIETFVPIKLQKTPGISPAYVFLEKTEPDTIFAVYPYNMTDQAMMLMPHHKRYLINPRWFDDGAFNSEEFTKELPSEYGAGLLSENNVDFLVVFNNAKEVDINDFGSSDSLELIKEFDDSFIFKVNK